MCWFDNGSSGTISAQELLWNEVILRRFRSDYCNITRPSSKLNTVMAMKIEKRPFPDMLLCDGTPMITIPTREKPMVHFIAALTSKVFIPVMRVDEQERLNAKRVLRFASSPGQDDDPWK